MKTLLAIVVLGVIGWAGYVYLDDLMAQERFGSAVELAIDDPRTRQLDQIRLDIQAAGERDGMVVNPDAIEFAFAASDVQPVAGQMVAGAGLAVASKRLTVRVPYERRVWGRIQHRMLERAKVYVATASPGFNLQDKVLSKVPETP